ncbi:TetR/AcrR family transcriptional regulator [Chloroflexota bacterium]
MTAHERRIERNKERILQATLELFKVHGIKKTTTNDIAQKAGVSPATVYNHFGTKEDLVRATVKYFFASIMVDFSKIFKGDLSFLDKMEQILSYKTDLIGSYQGDFSQMIISEDPEIRQIVDSIYTKDIMQMVGDFYDEGKKQGYINPELSTENIMRYLLIVRSGMAAESVLTEDPEYNRKVLQELTPLFLYGIMGRPDNTDS